MSFEAYEPIKPETTMGNNMGESLINRLERPDGNMKVSDLLDNNKNTIMETAANMVDHFSQIIDRLPKDMQEQLISSLPVPGPHDVVYAGIINAYRKTA